MGEPKRSGYDLQLSALAWKGDVGAIQDYAEKGYDLHAAFEDGMTYLHMAASAHNGPYEREGDADATRFLIEAGLDVNARQLDGTTPLHNAAWRGNMQAVRLLLAAGAGIMEKKNGETPSDRAWKVADNLSASQNSSGLEYADNLRKVAIYLRQVERGDVPRPTPEEVGLDMGKRRAALAKQAEWDDIQFDWRKAEQDREEDENRGQGRG